MRKSKYLILNSFYFKFDTKLSKIISVNKSFNEQNILDLKRFNNMNFIQKYIFAKLKLNFIFLPKNIEKIEYCAFYSNQIKILDLSNCIKLKNIREAAFRKNQIKILILPKNIEKIGSEAFRCNQIEILDLLHYIKLKEIHEYAFFENPLKEIKILNDIMLNYDNSNDLWNTFVKYYNDNNKKAGDYKLENNEWKWYPL